MKFLVCISSSIRAACQSTPACPSLLNRPLFHGKSTHVGAVIAHQPCVSVCPFHSTPEKESAVQLLNNLPIPEPVLLPEQREEESRSYPPGRRLSRKTARIRDWRPLLDVSPCAKPRTTADSVVEVRSVLEGDVVSELCCRLAETTVSDRSECMAALLAMCVEFGVDVQSPVVSRLKEECLAHLQKTHTGVAQLCRLGEVAFALEGRQSAIVSSVIGSLSVSLEDGLSPGEAVGVYSLLALCYEAGSQQQAVLLRALHGHTERLVHRLTARHLSDILQALVTLKQRQAVSLLLGLSRRASRVFKAFTDQQVVKLLSSLMTLGHHDEELLAAMEKHLPGRLEACDLELASTVMEYCLQMRCRSEPIFEAVAEGFVLNAEKHTTPQITKQMVAMGRLNYLPQCSTQMFKKLESVLSSRFSQFQPRSLIEVLHACIHLERFPLNYMSKVFSPYFLQKLQVQGEPLDKNVLGQLTQLSLSTSLECTYYRGCRLPNNLQLKKFSSIGQAFETPMDRFFYNQVKRPLIKLLGERYYNTRVSTSSGYTVDVELCLDEEGFVLPPFQWENTHRRLALCLDGHNRFCSNTKHLLGKEATKRRHLHRMGYEVIQIPYFEFEKLKTKEEQVQYLHNKIFPTIFIFSH
ncbi:FAST kinase domain-containing protein 3, mitochondrial-like [Lampris incognitus]|uniref:FAST kinase domain-containing protein 3, mitochondrial-like n=1 Tax=Lampris incognitus TaxID=2546036 RepID=UPI0024B56E8D|nr:FAST kinase domain-containing protein 3, mitochondrial-like [Lampris incognitus]